MERPSSIDALLESKRRPPEAVLEHIPDGADLIVGAGNGEPVAVMDAIEAAGSLRDVCVHQMLPMRSRRYIEGEIPGLRHVSWFLTPHDREAFHRGDCDLVPNSFSDVPRLMARSTGRSLVVVSTAPPDRHGYFSLSLHADYSAAMIGEVPFFVEANARAPRTYGGNQIHVSQVMGWCENDHPLVEIPPRPDRPEDDRIAALVAERIPHGATIQAGIGSIPDRVLGQLTGHRHLGIHSEVLSDGFVDLIERGVATGSRKGTHRNKAVTTGVIGSQRLFDFVHENSGVELWPVDHTNDPATIAREPRMVAINATVEVDFLGQCASEGLGSRYWSSSGGQPDYVHGAMMAAEGRSYIVLHSTTHDHSASRIVAQLHPGAAVTTFKNLVDCVVTEYGVAELRGSSIHERTRKLIGVAHPAFRDELAHQGRKIGYL